MTDSLTAQTTPDIQRLAESFIQWKILRLDGRQTDITSGQRYLLKNSTNRHFLHYKSQAWCAINLGFSDDAEPSTAAKVVQWQFVNRNGTAVKYDEPVAIRCKDGYVHYGHRTCGINLVWSNNPVFEWRLLGGPAGTPVKTGQWLCVFNMHGSYGEPMVYLKRELGGNFGWPSSKTLLQQGIDWTKGAVQRAAAEYLKSLAGGK